MLQVTIPATVVPGVSTLFSTIPVEGAEKLFVQLQSGVAALTGFAVKAKATPDASYDTLYSTAGDFTTPRGLLVGTSGDLTALASGARGWLIMDVKGLDTVQLFATSGGTATLALQARVQ